jgi:ATP-dependent Lon protease
LTDADIQLDQLDELANEPFAGRVVRKDLVRQVKVGANVPVYVLEFLLGKYCASDDPFSIEAGLMVVNQTLEDNFIRPDESELAKARVKHASGLACAAPEAALLRSACAGRARP